MWLKALAGYLRGGHLVGRGLVLADFYSTARALYIHAAESSGLLQALREPRSREELIRELGVERLELLDALLAEGLAWREIGLRDGRYRLRGRRAKALASDPGDAYAAVIHESIAYHGSVYSRVGERLRGEHLGDYLAEMGDVVARSSRMLEPPTASFLKSSLRRLRPSTVVDIGCGSGIYLRHASDSAPGITGVGVEMSERAALLAEAKLKEWGLAGRFRILTKDVRDISTDDRFDVALLFHNIYYFEPDERTDLFRSIADLLVPGGALLLVSYFKGRSRTARHFDVVLQSTRGNTPLPDLSNVLDQMREGGLHPDPPKRLIPREALYGVLAR